MEAKDLIIIDRRDASSAAIDTESWLDRVLGSEVSLSVGRKWIAGWNMPGYMPDSDPSEFNTFSDACRYIADTLNDFYYQEEEGDEESEERAQEYLETEKTFSRAASIGDEDEMSERAGQYVFWVREGDSRDLDEEIKDKWLMQAEDALLEAIQSEEGREYRCTSVDNVYNNENDFSDVFQWQVFYPADAGDWCYADDVYVAIEVHQGGDVRGNYGRIRLYKIDDLCDGGFLDWSLGWSVRYSDGEDTPYAEECSIGYHSNPFWSGLVPHIKGGDRGLMWSEKRGAYVGWDTDGRAVECFPFLYV
ncbi:hypothetical protein AWB76_07202 [Caballeronia temeraria]|uniref:Uncharacterized protein n=1 Tax=Caballeronia temeraria TaxID=1777137 RepID=A0A158DMJ9_9BURK|nr:hypothetical protein [Caballeronia temeraria]SAK95814.1 hypothetical protein AWB76_07202 [Caballeronia temeraria]